MQKSDVQKLPGDAYSKRIRARFWIVTEEGEGYLGIGRITLLENIDRFGSINRAAKEMGMSYKKAWKLVEDMNKLTHEPLVLSEKGGKSGGGTFITPLGKAYIKQFHELDARLRMFLEAESGCFDEIKVHD